MSNHPFWQPYSCIIKHRLSASSGTNRSSYKQTNKKTNKQMSLRMTWNKCKCTHNNINITCKVMKKNMKTRIQTKRANKHNRPSCLISTSISVHSMLFSNYQNCGYVVYKFVNCVVWFVASLLQVCYKFVTSLLQVWCKVWILKLKQTPHPTETIPYSIWFYWLVNW
jgi:hypothetical protein